MPAPDHSSPDPPLDPVENRESFQGFRTDTQELHPGTSRVAQFFISQCGIQKTRSATEARRKPSTGIFRAEKELPTLLSNFYDTFMEKYSLFSADGGRQMTFLGGYREGPILRICAGWYKLSHSPLIGAVHSPVRRVTLEIEISASRGSGRGCSHQTPSCSAG